MEINNAEFIISNTDVKKCPSDNLPEYAFIGRSNVGKSSLINITALLVIKIQYKKFDMTLLCKLLSI